MLKNDEMLWGLGKKYKVVRNMQKLCRRTLAKLQKPEKTYKNHKISKGDGC